MSTDARWCREESHQAARMIERLIEERDAALKLKDSAQRLFESIRLERTRAVNDAKALRARIGEVKAHYEREAKRDPEARIRCAVVAMDLSRMSAGTHAPAAAPAAAPEFTH
jgi:hypothetical protein